MEAPMPLLPSSKKGFGYRPDPQAHLSPDFMRLGLSPAGELSEFSLEQYIPNVGGRKVILDQGATSSCVAHAFLHAIYIAEQRAGLPFMRSSVLYIYYHARRQERPTDWVVFDQGTYLRTCADGLNKYGVCPEEFWSFSENTLKVNRRPKYQALTEGHPRAGGRYARIFETGDDRVRAVKAALVGGHAVAFGTLVADSFLDSRGALSVAKPLSTERIAGGHAMTIIGWEVMDGETWFRVLNSWGDHWRDGGMVLMHQDYITWDYTNDLHVVYGWRRLQEAV
jgi:hypothetical protein